MRGNLVPDAHLAAVLVQHGVTRIYTHDQDFRKFDALEVIDPWSDDGDGAGRRRCLYRATIVPCP
ncbi:MAG: type II toxin-antitoxin system VapC family toxin [Burkholderiaceae bacterium]